MSHSPSNGLVIKELSVTYQGKPALRKVDLQIDAGSIYTVIGPSGCGKSTLLRAIAGLVPGYEGTIEFAGQPMRGSKPGDRSAPAQNPTPGKGAANDLAPKPAQGADLTTGLASNSAPGSGTATGRSLNLGTNPASAARIGLVPQNYGLLPWKTVQANIRVALQIARPEMGRTEQSAAVNRWLTAMGIGELAARYPLSLSGGQQQRVAIARAFALMPQLMLLDEPFSALDALTREKLQRLFLENWQANPTTALFVTHDVEEAVLLGEKILLMPSGEGRALTLLDNPLFKLPLADKRESDAFFEQTKRIRKVMQETW